MLVFGRGYCIKLLGGMKRGREEYVKFLGLFLGLKSIQHWRCGQVRGVPMAKRMRMHVIHHLLWKKGNSFQHNQSMSRETSRE
jgi:hypothetical protein